MTRAAHSVAPDGFFALGLAAFFGHTETVTWLLDHGADVNQNASNAQRVTALHGAVARGNARSPRCSSSAGPTPTSDRRQDWRRCTKPLRTERSNWSGWIDKGAQVDIRTDAGKTRATSRRSEGKPNWRIG